MSLHLLEYVARQYLKKGFRVFGVLPGNPHVPDDWEGPFPDLCVEKNGERIAFIASPHNLCLNEIEPRRLAGILKNERVQVHLISNCQPCTCGIKEMIRSLPAPCAQRIMIRRFMRGKIMKWEFLRFYFLGLTVRGWLLFLPFLVAGFLALTVVSCFACVKSLLGFLIFW